ncbi:MAG: hypothetical protein Q7R91_02925 [bacterium]|nr:hypothetical protein [bacterium]
MQQGGYEKVQSPQEGGIATRLSAEEIKRFNELLPLEMGYFLISIFKCQRRYEDFEQRWNHVYTVEGKRELLNARKQWVEMKKGGEAFEGFFVEKMREVLNAPIYDGSLMYTFLHIYSNLGYNNATVFLGEALTHKSVRDAGDGSNVHTILETLSGLQDPAAAPAVIEHIGHITAEEYTRKQHCDTDLYCAVKALKGFLGDETKKTLETLADKDLTFAGWFAKNKATLFSEKSLTSAKKLEFDEFDPKVEDMRIKVLEQEYEDFRQSPPPMPEVDWSVGKTPSWTSPFTSPFEDKKGETLFMPSTFAPIYKKLPPGAEKKSGFEKGGALDTLDLRAEEWEKGKLVNFYGRFRPKIEKGVTLTEENYLRSIFATADASKEKSSCASYTNFLAGIVSPESVKTELPEKLDVGNAYRIAALAFGRALCLGVLEQKSTQGIREIDLVKDFFAKEAEKMADTADISFMLALSSQLGSAQEYLAMEKGTPPRNLPESAASFFLNHPATGRIREIPDFHELLAEKIRWYLANDFFYNLQEVVLEKEREGVIVPSRGPSFKRIRSIIDEYERALNMYRDVDSRDIPIYWEASEKLKEFGADRIAVFGRDGRYFFSALKAAEFGTKERVLKYVVVTSHMGSPEMKNYVVNYLRQNGVTLDFTFIDTGFAGSVPEFSIRYLAEAEGVSLSYEEVDKRIKLLSSASPKRRHELSLGKRSYARGDAVSVIEERPKVIASPVRFVVDERGKIKPEILPNMVREQLSAWVVEHATVRSFAPKFDPTHLPVELGITPSRLMELQKIGLTPEMILGQEHVFPVEEKTKERRKRFSAFLKEHLGDISSSKRQELLDDAVRLYEVSRDIVGPVMKDFSAWALEKLPAGQKLLFLARDALGPWMAARLLVRKGEFPGVSEDQLRYAFLSRKVMHTESGADIKKYLEQVGVRDDKESLTMVDVGVYGDIHHALKNLYPKKSLKSLFFISDAGGEEFEGFLYDSARGGDKLDSMWKSISGNSAVHFIEDTFSGFYGSTKGFTENPNGTIQPRFGAPYSREVYLKRLAALTGIIDRALLGNDGKSAEEHKRALEVYLSEVFPGEKQHLMVPHEIIK